MKVNFDKALLVLKKSLFWFCIGGALFDLMMAFIANNVLKVPELRNVFLVSAVCWAVGAWANQTR